MWIVHDADAAFDALLVAEVGGDEFLCLVHAHLGGLVPEHISILSASLYGLGRPR